MNLFIAHPNRHMAIAKIKVRAKVHENKLPVV